MAQRTCSHGGCELPLKALGYCSGHHSRLKLGLALDGHRPRPQGTAEERFWPKVDRSRGADACWLWTGARTGPGRTYGSFLYEGRNARAHRVAYTLVNGPIPDGLTIDHLCRVRLCVNPSHLEAVTNHENLLRGEGFVANNSRKTHCPQGHPYDINEGNRKHRGCSRCRLEAQRRRRAA